MKRKSMKMVVIGALLILFSGAAFGMNWHETRHVNKYLIDATIQNNPPKVGENPITVVVRDEAGVTVTDAKVFIEYDMPGMHHNEKEALDAGMFTKDLLFKGGKYTGSLNFSMPGEWVIHLKTVRAGKAYTATHKVVVK